MIKKIPFILRGNEGAALVIALLIMAVLSIIGVSATMTSSIETKISGNHKFSKQAFYTAEGGWPAAMGWLDGQSVPFLDNREVNDVALGTETYSYILNYQDPPKRIAGYSIEYKDFWYEIDCTGSGPADTQSEIEVTVSRAYKVGY